MDVVLINSCISLLLLVSVPPSVVNFVSSADYVLSGEQFMLSCDANGTAPLNLSLLFQSDGSVIISSSQSLSINATLDQVGEYRCQASNDFGNSTEMIIVQEGG